jgi:hypothetical protein
MYIARFAVDGTAHVACALQVDPRAVAGRTVEWDARVESFISALLDLPHAWITQRISVHRGRLLQYWLITFPAAGEQTLRRWAASLVRMGAFRDGHLRTIDDREAYDAMLEHVPDYVARVTMPAYEVGSRDADCGAWFGERFAGRLGGGSAVRRACAEGRQYFVQTTFTPSDPTRESLRELKRNRVRLADIASIGAERLDRYDAILARYMQTSHCASEFIGAGGVDAASWLAGLPGNGTVALEPIHPGDETLQLGIDLSPAPYGVLSEVLGAVSKSEICAAFTWSADLATLSLVESGFPHDQYDETVDLADVISLRPAVEPGVRDRFVFLSYCRKDVNAVPAIVQAVESVGVRVWYDADLRGGSDWLASIERRVEDCTAVIALMSRAAAMSRFVRDEIAYAHIRDKTIVPIRLDDEEIPSGLRIMLARRNWLHAASSRLPEQLASALEQESQGTS